MCTVHSNMPGVLRKRAALIPSVQRYLVILAFWLRFSRTFYKGVEAKFERGFGFDDFSTHKL